MEKRVFLAIFLSFVVLALYQAYFAPPPPVPQTQPAPALTEQGAPPTTPPVPAAPSGAEPDAGAEQPTPPSVPAAQPLVADTEEREIVVETESIRAVFSNKGAVLKSWRLKHYQDEDGGPLELVPSNIPESFARPFTMATDDAALSATLATALFQASESSLTLADSAAGVVSFQYSDDSGLNARKTFHIQPDGKPYVLNVEASVDVDGTSRPVTLSWGPSLGIGYPLGGSREIEARALLFQGDDIERISAATLFGEIGSLAEATNEDPGVLLALDRNFDSRMVSADLQNIISGRPSLIPRYSGQIALAGVEDHYFMAVALPGAQAIQVGYVPVILPVPGDTEGLDRRYVDFSIELSGAATLPFFIGPKEIDVLRDVDPEFTNAIDFGIFRPLVVPMLQALKWVHGYIGNWGFSIIALTIIINLVMFPLRHKSMVSMRKMQAIQPEIKALQERYKKYKVTDPERQKMNSEMMALYKQKGVNPASGCVPMLLTMPVLFAMYSVLQVAIELRGAPFIGWIQDLSLQDPYYIWPVLMGATMFWQMRISPTTADPVQAKVFQFMPVMFTFMFLWFPVGLVIYWLTSNVMAIGQQYLTNSMIGPPPRPGAVVAATAPPETAESPAAAAKAGKPGKSTKSATKSSRSGRKKKS